MQIEGFTVDQADLAHIDLVCRQRFYVKIANALLRVSRKRVDLRGQHDTKAALHKIKRSDNAAAYHPCLRQKSC